MPKKLSQEKALKMLGPVKELYRDSLDGLNARRDELLENLSFYADMQYTVRGGEYIIDDAQGEAVELCNNIKPIVRAAVAATIRQQINVSIPSTQGDQKARARAEAAEELCRAFQHNGVIDYNEQYDAVLWSKICGLSWMKVYWDPNAGRAIETDRTGFEDVDGEAEKEELDEFGEKISKQLFEGDICTEFVSSVDGLCDPSISNIYGLKKRGAYFFHRKLRPARQLEDMFPTDFFGKPTKGRFEGARTTQEQTVVAELTQVMSRDIGGVTNTLGELVEFWENPTEQFPNGRLIIFSGGDLILYMGPNILKPARLPFVPLKGDNPMPGSLFAHGVVQSLKANQRSYNRAKNKIREWADKMMNGRVLLPMGSGVDPNSIGDISGQVLEYNKGYRPEVENPPEIPGSLFNYLGNLNEEMKASSGYSDVAQGLSDQNISTGRHYAFAKEAASSVREPDMQAYRVFLITVLQHCLYLARQFYDEGRLVRVCGEDGRWILREFYSDRLDLDNDLVIEVFSAVPDSAAQRFSETVELFTAGALDPNNPAAVNALKILGNAYYRSSTFDKDIVHKDRAKRQILQVMQEPWKELDVNAWDNHSVWLDEIDRWRATPEYEELADFQKEKVMQAAEMHEQYLAQQNQVFGQDMSAVQGGASKGGLNAEGSPQAAPGTESPADGGNPMMPAAPPSMEDFAAGAVDPAAGSGSVPFSSPDMMQ